MRLAISRGSRCVALFAFSIAMVVGVSCGEQEAPVGIVDPPFNGAGGAGGAGGEGGQGAMAGNGQGGIDSPASGTSGVGSSGVGGGAAPAPCIHGVCKTGPKLLLGCDPCVDLVCDKEPDCCELFWGEACVGLSDKLCNAGCCGDGVCMGETCTSCPGDCGACVCGDGACNGIETCSTCAGDCGPCPACPHAVCAVGGALDPMVCRDACVDEVCAQKPECCSDSTGTVWNGTCGQLADTLCDGDPCVTDVCAAMPSCCTNGWTQACVDEAKKLCAIAAPIGPTSITCACGSLCTDGPKKAATCDPCVEAVCLSDSFCCASAWDANCVKEVGTICGIACN